ncbi:MAG: hypothetical protein WDO13_19810 [Verrucomicrobiota bacterium]
MPDVVGAEHAHDLRNAPQVKAQPTPQPTPTPPKPQPHPQPPTPPQPEPQMAQQMQPRPPEARAAQAVPKPPPPQKPKVQIDPDTGLPVLPPIQAPTMARPDQAKPLAPSASEQQQASSMHGALGMAGDTSPAAMATDLGKYKQYLYGVVGSYWYPDINTHFGTIGTGVVQIQFTHPLRRHALRRDGAPGRQLRDPARHQRQFAARAGAVQALPARHDQGSWRQLHRRVLLQRLLGYEPRPSRHPCRRSRRRPARRGRRRSGLVEAQPLQGATARRRRPRARRRPCRSPRSTSTFSRASCTSPASR